MTAKPSAKPMPKVVSFQDPLPSVVFTESEFCHLLAGVIVVTGDDGSQRTFRAGDAFVSPAGFTGTWEIVEPAKKLYAYYE